MLRQAAHAQIFIAVSSGCVDVGRPFWREHGMLSTKFKLYCDRRPVSQFCLGTGPQIGAYEQILITVGHLRSSCFGTPFLTRGRVCNLLIKFALTLRSKSPELMTISYCLI
jgi:hypothetical protein